MRERILLRYKEENVNLIAMTTLLLPAVYSSWVQTSITSGMPNKYKIESIKIALC